MTDENRTHDSSSAINDDNVGAAPAGLDNLPEGLADEPMKEGEGGMAYTLQNFNGLVAANTAMQTAIADAGRLEATLREQIEMQIAENDRLRERQETDAARIRGFEKRAEEHYAEMKHGRAVVAAHEKRMERALGYLDRVLDEEDAIRAPSTETVRTAGPPAGPDIRSIHIPTGTRRSDTDGMFATAARVHDSRQRDRRY